jgi:hypothetical protein
MAAPMGRIDYSWRRSLKTEDRHMPRDIRPDLQERLASVAVRYADEMVRYDREREALDQGHKETIEALERERKTLQQLLAIEDGHHNVMPDGIKRTARLVRLDDFLVGRVRASGPMDKDQLRAEADLAGYFVEGNGRTFHTTLMNIVGHRLIRQPDGRYALPDNQPGTLFGMGNSTEEAGMKTLM